MSKAVTRRAIIWSIVRKDLKEYSRDRLWMFLSLLTLVLMIAVFWVLPDSVDESIAVGITGLDGQTIIADLDAADTQGLRMVAFASPSELESVIAGTATAWVSNGQATVIANDAGATRPEDATKADVKIGLAFLPDFFTALAAGRGTTVDVYVDAALPEEITRSMSSLVRELAFAISGKPLPVDVASPQEVYIVLGQDRAGNQVTPREWFRPMLIFMVLVMEMFGMSSLIAREIQSKTVVALLVTPARTGDILVAKGIAGVVLGLTQAVVLLAAVDLLTTAPLLIVCLILLGAVMVSGAAMIAGTFGRDFMSNLFSGMLFMIPLLIPAFTVLFPGSAAGWVRVLPSYPLVRGLVNVSTYGYGWSDSLGELGMLLAWCVALFALGWIVLKRKVETI